MWSTIGKEQVESFTFLGKDASFHFKLHWSRKQIMLSKELIVTANDEDSNYIGEDHISKAENHNDNLISDDEVGKLP